MRSEQGPAWVEGLADSLSTGLVYVDDDGVIRFVNRRAEEMLAVSRKMVLGKRVDMLPLRTPLYKVLSDNSLDNPLEMSINGRVLAVRTSGVEGGDGCHLGVVTELRDITAEKRERREREEFVAMMTHDLKSPLTVMLGYIQAIKFGMLGNVGSELSVPIDEVERSAFSLLAMIEDILDAYRLEVGLIKITPEPCDVSEIVAGCCRDLSRDAEAHGVTVTCPEPTALPPFPVDSRQMGRVFANLIGNAVKFTPPGGSVTVTTAIDDGKLSVSVRDTGIGIAEYDVPRVFNKYFRASKAAGFKGTGLGLTISRAIVEAHGGAIGVESREGMGSTFTVTIPLDGTC